MKLTGAVQIHSGDVYSPTRYQEHPLGAIGMADNGDLYRYIYAGATDGTDLVAGKLYVASAVVAAHQNMTVAVANVVGDKIVTLDLGAAAVTAHQYDEGMLYFNDNSPEGEWYKIVSHETSAAGSEECKFTLDRGLLTATVVDSSEATITKNPYRIPAIGQLITEKAAGVAIRDWDLSKYQQYGWLKTRGRACVLIDTTGLTTGYIGCISNQVDGALGLYSDVDAERPIAQMLATGTAGEYNPVDLFID